jgi:hypothetical protein
MIAFLAPKDFSDESCSAIWRCIRPEPELEPEPQGQDIAPVYDFLRTWLDRDASIPALQSLAILLREESNPELAGCLEELARSRCRSN